jgi:hypothetical protein
MSAALRCALWRRLSSALLEKSDGEIHQAPAVRAAQRTDERIVQLLNGAPLFNLNSAFRTHEDVKRHGALTTCFDTSYHFWRVKASLDTAALFAAR